MTQMCSGTEKSRRGRPVSKKTRLGLPLKRLAILCGVYSFRPVLSVITQ